MSKKVTHVSTLTFPISCDKNLHYTHKIKKPLLHTQSMLTFRYNLVFEHFSSIVYNPK